ncbi:MAG: 30S ribosomal protein S3 [Deltaproteobacteria bacterium]|nr:30S ribosomal protein S3 [Deltaproteobacteria bacterium]
MGQKVHPYGFRLGINKPWLSKWYASGKYASWLHEDLYFRKEIKKRLYAAGVSKIRVERAANKVKIVIHTARPGLVIGKKGSGIDALREELQRKTQNKELFLDIQEIRKAETDAQLVAENLATQLERRVPFRRAVKKSVQSAMKFGAKGIKVMVGGRLGGSEIARSEWYREGRVPLQTLRADIDFGFAEAKTTYGIIGVKVWVFKGEIFDKKQQEQQEVLKVKTAS